MNTNAHRYSHSSNQPKLGHIPGHYGAPVLGKTLSFLANPFHMLDDQYKQYGPVSRTRLDGEKVVLALGPGLTQAVTQTKQQHYSSRMGYSGPLGDFLTGSLLLQDGLAHQNHRQIIQERCYHQDFSSCCQGIQAIIERHLDHWATQPELPFYSAIKALLLNISSHVFCGFSPGDKRMAAVNQAFLDMQCGMRSLIKKPWPGMPYQRGIEARKRLQQLLQQQLAEQRGHNSQHVLGLLYRHRSFNGETLNDQAITDHLIFLLLATHNAVTSVLTMTMLELVKQPHYQQQLRHEAQSLATQPNNYPLSQPQLDQVFNETLRLYPPVPHIFRRSLCDTELNGYFIPANTLIQCSPLYTQRMEQYWPAAGQFNPERFNEQRQEHLAHPHIWQPFGAGAHQCIGQYVTALLYREVMTKLLLRFRFSAANSRAANSKLQYFPCIKPLNNLPVQVQPAG